MKLSLKGFIRDSLRGVKTAHRSNQQFFKGVYGSFAELPETKGYNADQWYQSCVTGAKRAKAEIGQDFPKFIAPSKHLLPMLVCGMGTDVSILDFGGAGGLDYAGLRSQTGDKLQNIHYRVIDLETACKAGRDVWGHEVDFSTEIEGTLKPDIVYCYSALHAVPNWREIAHKLAKLDAKHVLLCKHPITTQSQSFVRQQINMGKGYEVPQWVISLKELTDIMESYGYVLTFRCEGEDKYSLDNYEYPYNQGLIANLLFQKL